MLAFTSTGISQHTKVSELELRHVELLTFKPSTKEEVLDGVKQFASLHGKVAQVKKFERGLNISLEHLGGLSIVLY